MVCLEIRVRVRVGVVLVGARVRARVRARIGIILVGAGRSSVSSEQPIPGEWQSVILHVMDNKN